MLIRTMGSLSDHPDFVNAFARTVSEAEGKVCSVCGLERMGHVPESRALGYEKHEWQPVPADATMLQRAGELTSEAYRRMREVAS